MRNSIKNLVNEESSIPRKFDRNWVPSRDAVSSRDVKLAVLQHRYLSAKDIESKIYLAAMVEQEMEYRLQIDLLFDELVKYVAGYVNNDENQEMSDDFINILQNGHIIPTNYECLKYVYSKYEENCENRFTDYSLKYVNTLVNLCQVFDNPQVIEQGFKAICS